VNASEGQSSFYLSLENARSRRRKQFHGREIFLKTTVNRGPHDFKAPEEFLQDVLLLKAKELCFIAQCRLS
jgi:hypothetical protein